MNNSLGIRGYDYLEFYVGSAKMTAYWFAKAFGLQIKAYMGPETNHREKVSYLLVKNQLKIVVSSTPRPDNSDIDSFVQLHGDGVKRWALNVQDVERTFNYAVSKGAIPVKKPYVQSDEQGQVTEAALKLYDDSEIVLINSDHYKGIFKPGYGQPIQDLKLQAEDTGLVGVDHIVGNVRTNEMDHWANYFNKALDFQTFVDFGPGDITTQYSALLSKVVRSSDSIVKNPINEPYKGLKKSQIEEYIDEYHGTGIQHIAISTRDIISSVRALKNNGVEFLARAPKTYYQEIRNKSKQYKITEDIDQLEELGILCDLEGEGYLLQLFTKPISDRPTFFFEIIQRRDGASGFGKGNFQALFEAIEKDQALRGNLV